MLKVGQVWESDDGRKVELMTWDQLRKRRPGNYDNYERYAEFAALVDDSGFDAYCSDGHPISSLGKKYYEYSLVRLIQDVEDTEVKIQKLSAVEHAVNILELSENLYQDIEVTAVDQIRSIAKYLEDNKLV
jgi:hypothetical protein